MLFSFSHAEVTHILSPSHTIRRLRRATSRAELSLPSHHSQHRMPHIKKMNEQRIDRREKEYRDTLHRQRKGHLATVTSLHHFQARDGDEELDEI